MSISVRIHGTADDGYGKVADTFAADFTTRGEVGAAVTLYVGDRKVVDL